MTKEEIRIACAEAMGVAAIVRPIEEAIKCYAAADSVGSPSIPNYPEDLNACAEMEKSLTPSERIDYLHELVAQQPESKTDALRCTIKAISASAIERCIAFLKVKGLCRENSN